MEYTPINNINHNTIYQVETNPCIDPITSGVEAPSMAIAVVLNTQKTPIPINSPRADSQNVYQNVSGKFKLAGGDKNSNPIKFAFVP